MSIHKRTTKQGVRWDVRYRVYGRQISRAFPTKAEAQSFDEEQRRHKRMGAFAPQEPSSETLESFMLRWFEQAQWRATTRTTYAGYVDKWIVPAIGHIPLRDLGRARVRQFRSDIMRLGSPATNTNNVMRVLSAAMSAAVDEGMIPLNPCLRLGAVPQDKPQRRAYSREVTDALIAAMPTDRDKAAVMLLRDAGLRPAEVVGLRWRDIGDGYLTIYETVQRGATVPTKTGVFRSVPIEAGLAAQLALLPRHHEDDYVIPGLRGGPLNWRMWTRRVWGPARDAVGTDAVPYSMRHTFASMLIIERRLDVATAAAFMGHSPKVMLDHYVHLFQIAHAQGGQSGPQAHEAA